jgi:tetratricopeptide (TPR) repeat protein
MTAARRGRAPLLLAALLCLLPAALAAQAEETLDNYTAKARAAISQNAYESAVKTLTEARLKFPASPRPSLALGDLYYDKELYAMALGEYREAEKKGAGDYATLTQISRCFGKLNQEKSSIEYLTRILEKYPESADTVDDLGWMYFKTHQLVKGEQVLSKGIARLGMQRGMAMTLGTVYSGLNQFEKARAWYQKSIDEALRAGDRDFASIAYYNLSLLEHNALRYNSSLRYTDESIAMEDRPSGHLARGELLQFRMDFPSALREFEQALAKDTTPLSRINLAILYQKFGRLELARRYAEEVLASKDLAWLMYYGTDTTRHFKDIYELLSSIYGGLARRELGRPTTGIADRLSALAAAARDAVLSWYHGQRFRMYCLQVGRAYLSQGAYEDAWWEFYRGSTAYPEVALKYLAMARDLETARTPRAQGLYLLEQGKVERSAAMLQKALTELDPFWEKEPAASALVRLVPLLRGGAEAALRRQSIARLFEINPGALPQAGIGLPFAVQWSGEGWKAREKAIIVRYLRRAGSEVAEVPRGFVAEVRRGFAADGGFRYTLRFTRAERTSWQVRDSDTGTVVAEGSPAVAGGAKRRSAMLVKAVLEELYAVH